MLCVIENLFYILFCFIHVQILCIIYHKGYSIPEDPKGTGEITVHLGEALLVKMVT